MNYDTLKKGKKEKWFDSPSIQFKSIICILITSINKVYYYFHHHIFFFSPTLGYHKCECYKGIVGNSLRAILEDSVIVHKPKEQCGCNALVSITERMVLRNKVE